MDQNADELLWKIAKKRADFKRHLVTYIVINLFFWGIWWLTEGQYGARNLAYSWPAWTSLTWGVFIAFRYFNAYGHTDREISAQEEFNRLKRRQQS